MFRLIDHHQAIFTQTCTKVYVVQITFMLPIKSQYQTHNFLWAVCFLTAATIKKILFLFVTPCIRAEIYLLFEGTHYLCLQKIGILGFPETAANCYQATVSQIPEDDNLQFFSLCIFRN